MIKKIKLSGVLIVLLLSLNLIKAQDTIFFNDGSKGVCKIIEVTKDEVKYKSLNNIDGPLKILDKSEVDAIYKEGKKLIVGDALKKRVALGNIKDYSGNPGASSKITSIFSTELFKSKKFSVIEQDAIADLIKEGDLSPSNLLKISRAGVQILITGGITDYGVKKDASHTQVGQFGNSKVTYTAKVTMDVKLRDASTGEILYAGNASSGDVTQTNKSTQFGGIGSSSGSFDQTMLDEATRKAIKNCISILATEIKKIKWTGSIVKVEDDNSTIYFKPGSNDGVQVGMEFKVYNKGEQIIDPDLGTVLSSTEKFIGKIKVTNDMAGGKVAKCQIIEGSGFNKGDIVRED